MIRISLLLLACSLILTGIAQNTSPAPVVLTPVYFDVSPLLSDLQKLPVTKADLTWKDGIVKNRFNIRKQKNLSLPYQQISDPGIQPYNGTNVTDTTVQNFDGIANPNGYLPPDTDGDVGPNHYFQVVNASYAVFSKTGTNISGTHNTSTIWTGMPNNSNSGDAVVLYDEQADRWLISQFSLPNYPNGPFYEMIAVTTTNDPTGSWYRYQYSFTDMPDYPKFGIWPDGYYMSMNRFTSGAGNWAGVGAVAFNRTQMIAGNPTAQSVMFTLPSSDEASSLLPADCDGAFPTTGTPNYFTYINTGPGPQHLGMYEFHVDWTTTANSTFSNLLTLAVSSFSNFTSGGIPQQGSSQQLDPIDDRLMFRLQYRKFSAYQSMVCNHTVKTGTNQAGIRWYELRNTGSGWSVYQQSTWSPDTRCRWMGSVAIDTAGTIALGYSVSSSSMYPSIRYTGRVKTDPLNTMTYVEHGIYNGAGAQTNYSGRWGDYSCMSVDPAVPNTFWYTTEYYASTSSSNWRTRIASFSLLTSNVLSINATAMPSQVNPGSSSQLNVTATGGTGAYAYSWTSVPAGYTSNIQNPMITPSLTTKYVAHVTSGTQTKTDTVEVLVTMSVLATANPSTVNPGGSSQLNASALGGNGTYTYSWTSIPAGYSSNIENPLVTPTQTTQYIITLSDAQQTARDTVQVTVNGSPLSATATATPAAICSGETSQLNCDASGGSGNYTYSWTSLPSGFTSNLQNPLVQPSETTVYTVVVNDGVNNASAHTGVSVQMPPSAYAGSDTIVCTRANMFWVGGASAYFSSVQWTSSGDGTFSTPDQLSTIYYPGVNDKTSAGIDIYLTSYPISPCDNPISAPKHITFDPCTGISESNPSGLELSLRPNPAHNQVNLLLTGVNDESVAYMFVNTDGKIVMKGEARTSSSRFSRDIDVSSLSKGVYLIRVVSGRNMVGSKLVVK